MPRFDERTQPGKITSEVFKSLSEKEREGIEAFARHVDREREIRSTDIVNELVLHEISRATKAQGKTNIDEKLVAQYVKGMIPEGKEEAKRFFQTIDYFKKALAEGNFDVVNSILADPERHRGEGLGAKMGYWFESYDRIKRPEQNERLKLYLRTILERKMADAIDSGNPDDVDRLIAMVDGIDLVDSILQECIPVNPGKIVGNPTIATAALDMLDAQYNAGRRPKVVEALQLNLVLPTAIPDHIRDAAAEHAAQPKDPWSGERPFEKAARTMVDEGAYRRYRDVASQPDIMDTEMVRLLDLLRAPATLMKDHIDHANRFVVEVEAEVFRPFHGLTPADQNVFRNAEKAHAKALKEGKAAAARTHRATMDTISRQHRRLTPIEFAAFLQGQVKPILRQNLSDVLRTSIDDYTALLGEYKKERTLAVEPYRYALLDDTDLRGRHFRENELRPAVEDRLNRAHAIPDGNTTYDLERLKLINEHISDDRELTRWGFPA